nr:MAG TPA: hypothetical protein [Caudoviricetes sp.]
MKKASSDFLMTGFSNPSPPPPPNAKKTETAKRQTAWIKNK